LSLSKSVSHYILGKLLWICFMFVCCRFSCNVMGNKFYSDCRFRTIPLQTDYIGYGRSSPCVTPFDREVGQCRTPMTTHRCGSVTKCRLTDREIGRLTFTAIESSNRDPGMLITIPETADCHYCRLQADRFI